MPEVNIDYVAPTVWVDADCGHRVPSHFVNRHADVDEGGERKFVTHCLTCAGVKSDFGEVEG